MKVKLITVLLFICAVSLTHKSTAQGKTGYVNADELLAIIPETAVANTALSNHQAALQKKNNDLLQELGLKDSLFVKDSARLTTAQKEFRRNELIQLYQQVQNFSTEAEKSIQEKQQELLGPVRQKAMNLIKTVAKEQGFSSVIDNSAGYVLLYPPENDLMPWLKKKLGL
jgi:outer membrane protein